MVCVYARAHQVESDFFFFFFFNRCKFQFTPRKTDTRLLFLRRIRSTHELLSRVDRDTQGVIQWVRFTANAITRVERGKERERESEREKRS